MQKQAHDHGVVFGLNISGCKHQLNPSNFVFSQRDKAREGTPRVLMGTRLVGLQLLKEPVD